VRGSAGLGGRMESEPFFRPSRAAALARLAEFLPLAGGYGAERNFVRPGHGQVARMSPWVQKRLVLEEEIVAAVLGRWPFPAVEKLVQEVYWRTYWKGWLEQRPLAWRRWRESVPQRRDELSGEQSSTWRAACEGRTGIAGFDDWARELVATGYLHNHARMWFASIWIFTLRLPWELGAAFFYEHLLDGDAASNTLSWRWVAGLQTAGKTYLARADNIAHYTDGRCRPAAGDLAAAAFTLREEPLPKVPFEALAGASGEARGPIGLWLHPEDLAVELGKGAGEKIVAVYAGWPTGIAERAGWGERVVDWTKAALAEGATRTRSYFAAEVRTGVTTDLAAELVGWALDHKLRSVVAYRPLVGPWADEGRAVERALAAAGITLEWKRRQWDTAWFPHADRGYFPFWERVKRAHAG
jgi:deoxyribodipyrimidine photo-lyase